MSEQAIRNRRDVRGKAHIHSGREQLHMIQFELTKWPIGLCGVAIRDAELVPLDQTAPEDRCKQCERRNRA
ncbi:hypothetical protein [Oerskovia paurometabola]|uniref:hypothetical protein n=1 Tax=Oerskovia paurometabola TaxID=162170 RepID=UPI0034454F1A